MLGSVLIGGFAGVVAAVTALFMGVGVVSALFTYVVVGFFAMAAAVTIQAFRPEFILDDSLPDSARPRVSAMDQWLQDTETRLRKEDDDDRPSRAA